MCGICGVGWGKEEDRIGEDVFDRMVDRLAHRGPDGRGVEYLGTPSNGMALGHRRLAIIDLSEQGRQPMCNEDGSLWLVFNGEIYNDEELREPLEQRGHRFRSRTDYEIILHLYEEHGEAFLEKLNGMYAFALYDVPRRRLLLVRDRIGKKPLFYAMIGDRLLFASEMKSLLEVPGFPREIDPTSIDDYLTYQYVPHPKTIYRDIWKLPPGHYGTFENGELTIRRYWNPRIDKENRALEYHEWSKEVRRILTDAVKIRLRSDVPFGAFLSGGIDSSITVGLMQRLASQKVRTFSIGFGEEEYDETRYARIASKTFGTEHERLEVRPDPKDLIDRVLPALVRQYDEPFGDSSAVPTWYLCESAKRHVTVALSGDGGDELFAGYDRYRAARLGEYADRLPLFLRHFLAGPVMRSIPHSTRQRSPARRLRRFLEGLDMEQSERYLQWIAVFNDARRSRLYADDFRRRLANHAPRDFIDAAFRKTEHRGAVSQASMTDILTYLPCDLMVKTDSASMAHALECRCPILDYRLVELAVRMPAVHKMHGRTGKFILRDTFRDILPDAIHKRGKMGFGVPLAPWFRGPLKNHVRDVLLDRRTLERGLFRREEIEDLLEEHFEEEFDHAYRIWSLLFLELWFRHDESYGVRSTVS